MKSLFRKSHSPKERTVQGFPVVIENPKGSTREGIDKDGHKWKIRMAADYGYIKTVNGTDGEGLDVYVGPNEFANMVYIVHQTDPTTGKYDEDKIMLSFDSLDAATKLYNKQYDRAGFLGSVEVVDMSTFKEMMRDKKLKGKPQTVTLRKSAWQTIRKSFPIAAYGGAMWAAHPHRPAGSPQGGQFDYKRDKKLTPEQWSDIDSREQPFDPKNLKVGDTVIMKMHGTDLEGNVFEDHKNRVPYEITGLKDGRMQLRDMQNVDRTTGYPLEGVGSMFTHSPKKAVEEKKKTIFDKIKGVFNKSAQMGLFSEAQAVAKPGTMRGAGSGASTPEHAEGEVKVVEGHTYKLFGKKTPAKKRWQREDEPSLLDQVKPSEEGEPKPPAKEEEPDQLSEEVKKRIGEKHVADRKASATPAYENTDLFSQPPVEEKEPETTEEMNMEVVTGRKHRQEVNAKVLDILSSKEDKDITPDEKKTLALYSGDGGTDAGSLNEFYTLPAVARFMWDKLRQMGFRGGTVLEPSCGAGVYIQTKPDDALVTGVEISPVSSRIAGLLHPNDIVIHAPFEEASKTLEDESFDASISNYPFGVRGASRGIDKQHVANNEEYFLETVFDKVNQGGIVAAIVPTGVIDNKNYSGLRESLSERGEFLGAYRLPNTAFKHTGTAVTSDMVFFKKHSNDLQQKIKTVKASDTTAYFTLKDWNVYDEEFLRGDYFTGKGAKNVWGELAKGNWETMTVKGKITDELLAKASEEEFNSKIDYDKIGSAKPPERELHVGDIVYEGDRQYRFNENHRWERVETSEEEVERRKNIEFTKFGVGSRDEFHDKLRDVSFRSKIALDNIPIALNYLGVLTQADFPEVDHVRDSIRAGMKVAMLDSASPQEARKYFAASILGSEVKELQRLANNGEYPDFPRYDAITLLLKDYADQYGNPNKDKALIRAAMEDANLARLVGALKDDGNVSDFLAAPERFVKGTGEKYDATDVIDTMRELKSLDRETNIENLSRWWKPSFVHGAEDMEKVLLQDQTVAIEGDEFLPMDKATSGAVYEKLDRWKRAIQELGESDDELKDLKIKKYQSQIDELTKKAKFKKLEDAPVKLNSRWIGMDKLNAFMRENNLAELIYHPETNVYEVDYTTDGQKPTFHNFYGDLIRNINNLGLAHGTENETRRGVLKEFEERFKAWLLVHADRDELEDTYNRTFNDYVNETYDDTPIKIDKIADGFDLNRYHYSAIRRLEDKGKGILAYDVGLGKTFASIALALHLKQEGKIKKPMAVVPKSVLANWVSEIGTLTKGKDVKLMVVGMTEKRDKLGNIVKDKDGKTVWTEDGFDAVQHKLQQIAQNDFDLVLMTRDKLDMLSLNKDTTRKYLDTIITKHIMASNVDEDAMPQKDGKKKGKGKHDLKESIARLEANVMSRFLGGHEKVLNIYFDQLGVDSMIVDEAHNYRRLFGLTGRPVKWAMGQPDTQRSIRMYMFAQHIREMNNNKNIFFLSATPTVNNPLESFNMLSYIAPEEFEKRKMYNIKDFLNMFGRIENLNLPTTSGEMKQQEALMGFQNLNELRQIFMAYTDMRNAKEVGLKMPEAKYENHYSDMSKLQKRIYGELRQRAKDLFEKDHSQDEVKDHIFSIISDMQKATISLDLLRRTGSGFAPVISEDEVTADGPSPKIKQYVDKAMGYYNAGKKHLCFAEFKELQGEIKRELMNAGVKESDIFIVNADTVASSSLRQKISNDYNAGKYKILIGNSTMAEGMNFQQGTVGVEHLTLPFTPAALQQRNGRGLRQGNKEESVGIGMFLTRGTYDNFLVDSIRRKQNWQYELWKGDEDEAKNIDTGMVFDPQELQIMLSDDPEAERIRLEASNQSAIEKQTADQKRRAMSAYNQYQNLIIQHGKMSGEERTSEKGKVVADRIESMKKNLSADKYFEHKNLLDGNAVSYIDPEKNTIIPTGHYFTRSDEDYKKHGVYRFTHIDPVNRKLTIERILPEGEAAKTDTHYGQFRYHEANPRDIGDSKEITYGQLREFFNFGISAVNVPSEYTEGELLRSVLGAAENMRGAGMGAVRLMRPETITEHKKEILGQIMKEGKSRKQPYLNPATNEVELVDTEKFVPPTADEVLHAETSHYWREMIRGKKSPDDIYLPIDSEKWEKDILRAALVDSKKYGNPYGSPLAQYAVEIFGSKWQERAEELLQEEPQTAGDNE